MPGRKVLRASGQNLIETPESAGCKRFQAFCFVALSIIVVSLALTCIAGCTTDGGYTRTGETKYRLNDVKLVIERIKTVDIDHSITDMDDIIAWALKNRALPPGSVESFKFDAWHNLITIIPSNEHSGVIVSNGPNGIYEAGKGDDICLAY